MSASPAARHELPVWIERAAAQTLTLELDEVPDSATITVFDGARTKRVNAEPVAVDGETLSYDLTAAEVPATLSLSYEWQIEWTTAKGARTRVYRQDAAIVLALLYPPATEADICRRHPDIAGKHPKTQTDWSEQGDEAWTVLLTDVLRSGRQPPRILSSHGLRTAFVFAWLEICYRAMATLADGRGRWQEQADHYARAYRDELDRIRVQYDADDDGQSEGEESVTSVLMLSAGPMTGPWGIR